MFLLVNPIAPPPYAPVASLSVIERFDFVSTRPGRQAPSIGRSCADSTPSIGDHRFDEGVKETVKNRSHRSFGFARSALFLSTPASSPPFFLFHPFFRPRSRSLYVRFFWWSTPVTTPRSGAVASRYASYPSLLPLAPIPDQPIPPSLYGTGLHTSSTLSPGLVFLQYRIMFSSFSSRYARLLSNLIARNVHKEERLF